MEIQMFYETRNGHGLPHNPFKSLVVPRPIGWISTVSASGEVNLAPYSFFNAVADSPPMVMFSGSDRPGTGNAKDTRANAEATGEFVFNLAVYEIREQMTLTSASHPPGVNEFEQAGLTPAPSRLVRPPRVKESPVHLECRYWKTVDLPTRAPSSRNFMVLGEVVGVHIDDAVLTDGMVDMTRLRPVARLGYFDYTVVDNFYTLEPPP